MEFSVLPAKMHYEAKTTLKIKPIKKNKLNISFSNHLGQTGEALLSVYSPSSHPFG